MTEKTIEELIDDHYDKLFNEICELGDNLYDLKIEYKDLYDGKTITRSWHDRDKRLVEEGH